MCEQRAYSSEPQSPGKREMTTGCGGRGPDVISSMGESRALEIPTDQNP